MDNTTLDEQGSEGCTTDLGPEAAESSNAIEVTTLGIADCSILYQTIQEKLNQYDQVSLNLAVCEEIDSAGLQLLAAIRSDEAIRDKVIWGPVSEIASSKATLLGLGQIIKAK